MEEDPWRRWSRLWVGEGGARATFAAGSATPQLVREKASVALALVVRERGADSAVGEGERAQWRCAGERTRGAAALRGAGEGKGREGK